jgi:MEDS: MEthanogen/methylotroph, DcmR Sensory domain
VLRPERRNGGNLPREIGRPPPLRIQAPWHDVLTNPRPRDHSVQLYRDDAGLIEALALLAGTGLAQGEAVVLVATPPHVLAVARRLQGDGFDLEQSRRSGQLTVIDAATLLARFTVDGRLDSGAFGAIAEDMLGKATAGGRRRVRVYGEMVDLLWKHDLEAATRLEELWNTIIASHPISLHCSYQLDEVDALRPFPPQLGRAHSCLMPLEASA